MGNLVPTARKFTTSLNQCIFDLLDGVRLIGLQLSIASLLGREQEELAMRVQQEREEANHRKNPERSSKNKEEKTIHVKEELGLLSEQPTSSNSALTESNHEHKNENNRANANDVRTHKGQIRSVSALEDEDKTTHVDVQNNGASKLQERIDHLSLLLARKESEYKKLTTINNQAERDLEQANSTVEWLKEEVQKSNEALSKAQQKLQLKKSFEDELNNKLKLAVAERDEMNRKYNELHEGYINLKSVSAERAGAEAELLSKKDHELDQLTKNLEIALHEAMESQSLIAEKARERDNLRSMLENETNTEKYLKTELQSTQEILRSAQLEAAESLKELDQSKKTYKELASELSRFRTEFAETHKALNHELEDVNLSLKLQRDEIASVKKALNKAKQELHMVISELKDVTEAGEHLKKELSEKSQKAAAMAHELEEERKVVASLRKELEELSDHRLREKEVLESFMRDFEEATKSLNEMNEKVLILSRDLDTANSKIDGLNTQKHILSQTLAEKEEAEKEALGNLEAAHSDLAKLQEETDALDKKSKGLQEQLNSAQADIAQLRREISSAGDAQDRLPINIRRGIERWRRGRP